MIEKKVRAILNVPARPPQSFLFCAQGILHLRYFGSLEAYFALFSAISLRYLAESFSKFFRQPLQQSFTSCPSFTKA